MIFIKLFGNDIIKEKYGDEKIDMGDRSKAY